jgi:hypothetical protein
MSSDSPSPEPSGSPDDVDPDSIVLSELEDVHYRLEIIEGRIRMGDNPENDHPALSISLLPHYSFKKLSPPEKEAKENYVTISEENWVPTFWEPRFWDTPQNFMTVGESCRLKEKLAAFQSPSFFPPTKGRSHPSKKRPPARLLSPDLSTTTDSIATESDDEEFDHSSSEPAPDPFPRTHIRTRSAGPVCDAPPKRHFVVHFSTKFYETDDIDDETDFSEF